MNVSKLTIIISLFKLFVPNSLCSINGLSRWVWSLTKSPKPKKELSCKIPKLIIWFLFRLYGFSRHWSPIQSNDIWHCLHINLSQLGNYWNRMNIDSYRGIPNNHIHDHLKNLLLLELKFFQNYDLSNRFTSTIS